MGVVRPRGGTVTLDGVNIAGRKGHAIAQTGMQRVPEDRPIFGMLNVEKNLVLAGLDRLEALAAWPHLRDVSAAQGTARPPRHRLIGLGTADAGDPAPWCGIQDKLLDEPFERSNHHSARSEVCRDLAAAGQTIVLVEQYLAATPELAQRISIIDNGHIVQDGPAREIRANRGILQR